MASKEGDEQSAASVQDVLRMGRWSKALFTTYSLSLSFFEGFLLRGLEDVGCSNINILVDEKFYKESLSERQAAFLGKSYQLFPISCMPPGIFHPKVTYLWGDSEDLIAVGSGNITYAGHGTNLECVDFASSAREPGVFADFADFLRALLERSSIDIGSAREVISTFRDRASVRGRKATQEDNRPTLFHSTTVPIGTQLTERFSQIDGIRDLLCMSPFHHPTGESLTRLANGIGVRRIDVGLDPDGLRAPFTKEALESQGLKARFVAPTQKETRPLHAKWYEFRGKERWILCGSVNATNQSLWTTENVEVALLRPVALGAEPSWIAKDPKRIEASSFEHEQSHVQGCLIAMLEQDGTIHGRISGVKNPAGKWNGELLTMLGRIPLDPIDVKDGGSFKCTAPEHTQESDTSVQMRAWRKDQLAAGWVSLRTFLEDSVDTRGARLSLSRLSRGEALEGDVVQIVNWLTSLIEAPVRSHGSGNASNDASQHSGADSSEITYTFDDWLSYEGTQRRSGSSVSDLVRKALVILARGHGGNHGGTDATGKLHPKIDPDLESDSDWPLPPEEYDIVNELIQVIDSVLSRQPTIPISVELALFKADYRLQSAMGADVMQALPARAMEWLRWVVAIAFPPTRKTQLEPAITAMAACAVGLAPEQHADAWAAEVREMLKKYLGRWSIDELKTLAEEGEKHRIFKILLPNRRKSLLKSLDTIWNARTVLDDLVELVEGLRKGLRPKPSIAVEQTVGETVLKALLEGARGTQSYFWIVPDPATTTRCPNPKCGASIDASERSELRWHRGIKCRGCSRAILWLGL